jgi:hypothetical protein
MTKIKSSKKCPFCIRRPLLTIPYYIRLNEDSITSEDLGVMESISWLYPDGFNSILSSTILAATNTQVEQWNNIVQQLNPKPTHICCSNDILSEVDDPHGYLKEMLTKTLMNQINHGGVPPHQLELKVDDICLLTRNLS